MDQYNKVAARSARLVTDSYSSSFGLATRLFPKAIRGDIYNIYGLVRVADEIVDTYKGADSLLQLDKLEADVYQAIKSGYSSNLIVHAFQLTARQYGIDKDLIMPFFHSMRLDITPQTYTPTLYKEYIDGSAEVVGLMCLKVFATSLEQYAQLEPGARALGAAFQKVNFLRDLAADKSDLERFYFPNYTFKSFDETAKTSVIADIENDFQQAKAAIEQLPPSAKPAVSAAYSYYHRLLQKLKVTPIDQIKRRRIRINNSIKLLLLGKTIVKRRIV